MRRVLPHRPAAAVVSALCVLLLVPGSLLPPAHSAPADAVAPRKKDSLARFKPKTAELTTSVEPSEARPGDTVTFKVTARVEPGNHIYKYTKAPIAGGPTYTTFDLFDPVGLKAEGDWSASREPIRHAEAAFANLPFVEYYEDEVTWSIKLKVPPDATPGKKAIRVQAGYMVCNDKTCSIPGQWTLDPAMLTVAAADGASKRSAPAPAGSDGPATASPPNDTAKPSATPAPPKEAPATAPAPAAAAESRPATPPPAATSNANASSADSNEIAVLARQGLIPFLLASALGGLFALVMPCVWPMVPITVNFFVKQGQGEGGRNRATGLAVTYCLSIIGVFTAVGVLCSFFFSATALPRLANNPWLNLSVAGLFILFGLSLLGLFEVRLPSFVLNASARGEGRGGLVGVIFMAMTLTITSFTCTFPVVGGLLVMAAGGDFFYPIVGLATFATVVALPFFLLALSPGLIQKMPRSGDWMNAVKVVGGLIEIGAALKFVNTAELAWVTPKDAWFNAYTILTSWVVLSLVCGFYLLGMFRTDHDHDEVKVGPGRLVSGALFLGLGLYLAPALFGHPPQGRIWDRMIVGILPPDVNSLAAPVQVASNGGGSSSMEVKATSTDPAQAEREQKSFHGVQWGMSFAQAREQAARDNKPILIDFTGVNCPNCRLMEGGVFPRPEVVELLKKFVPVQLYTDFAQIDSITAAQREELGDKNKVLLLDELKLPPTNPLYAILSPSGKLLGFREGYVEAPSFVKFLNEGLEKVSQTGEEKVAQTGSAPAATGQRSGVSQ